MKGYYRDCFNNSCGEWFPYKSTALKNKKLKTAVEAYISHVEYGYVIKTCKEKKGLLSGTKNYSKKLRSNAFILFVISCIIGITYVIIVDEVVYA